VVASEQSKKEKSDRKPSKDNPQSNRGNVKQTRDAKEDTPNRGHVQLSLLDNLHQRTKSGYNGSSRITLPSKRKAITLEDLDLISSRKGEKTSTCTVNEDYSDEEIEEAMAALPIPIPTDHPSYTASRALKRDLPKYSDDEERPSKRRKTSLPNGRQNTEQHPIKSIDSQIIEIDSTDSSAKSSQADRDGTEFIDSHRSKGDTLGYCDPKASPPPLFLPSSLSSHEKIQYKNPLSPSNTKKGNILKQDLVEYDDFFELDPNLFEGGEDTIAHLRSKSVKEDSHIGSERDQGFKPKQGNPASPHNRKTTGSRSPPKANSVDQQIRLFGDMTFDEFFNGIEIV
jgi:hypothetical protein